MVAARPRQVTFGKYTLLERIAVGGMAEVFLAIQSGLQGFEKYLAIKRIRPHLCGEEAFVRMFLNEARLAAQLQHPNIVQIFDLGRIGESYFIAMEYVSGRDMSRVIPRADKLGIRFPIEYALTVASKVLDGLAYAHAKTDAFGKALNIVHRDITPENIMLGWNGNVNILDFGIAKAATHTDQTKAGEIKGKLSYMSPEQAMGKTLDQRSDVFSLGIILYEWITGYRLFNGENEMAILKQIIDEKIYPPSYFREEIPGDVEAILMRALEKNRDKRYQSAREMHLAIHETLSRSEFSPSNAHLAGFMEQMFSGEVKQEQKFLAEAAQVQRNTPPPPPPIEGGPQLQAGELIGRAKKPSETPEDGGSPMLVVVEDGSGTHESAQGQELRVQLGSREMRKLQQASDRAQVDVERIIEDILRASIKYL